MSHQMTWYILAHMPYFRRPGHIYCTVKPKDTTLLNILNKTTSTEMDQINVAMMGYEEPQCKSLVASYWFWQNLNAQKRCMLVSSID